MSELSAVAPVQDAVGGPQEFARDFSAVHSQVCSVIRGKPEQVRLALVCLLAGGHLLVEDVPGVGKTSLAKSIARALGLSWGRAQFTPDLLPSDVTGASVFDRAANDFVFRPGAVFVNVLLADEINRASPKTQAALLEAMEERQVTVDANTYTLPEPFLVIATQNPVEHEGTYPLPVSELDRFLMKLHLGYPDRRSTLEILTEEPSTRRLPELAAVFGPGRAEAMAAYASTVYVAPALQGYLVDLAEATREHPGVLIGLSPRAVLGLQRCARCLAASHGRDYVVPDDVKALLGAVAEHRIVLSPELVYSAGSATRVVAEVLSRVPVPLPAPRKAGDV